MWKRMLQVGYFNLQGREIKLFVNVLMMYSIPKTLDSIWGYRPFMIDFDRI